MENKRLIGISIYPAHQSLGDMKKYIKTAADYGYKRIFASMLELTPETKEAKLDKFREIFAYARKLNFDVCLDVNPRIFDLMGAKPSDLKIFDDLGVTTVRLDMPLDGKSESEMTYNPYDLNIEINISNGTEYISNIISYKPKIDNLIGCHNFYPQRFAGLTYDFFVKSTVLAKKHGIRTCAFVSSSHGTQGPWSISDGLPTLEEHRDKKISTQTKHLWATGLIDDIIIGNSYATDEELESISKIDPYRITLSVIASGKTSDIEKEIINLPTHFRRGDINGYTIRSTMSRVWYKDKDFPPHDNTSSQKKGNIYIGNDTFGIYKGELQLAINDIPNDKRKNLVAKVVEEDLFLLEYIDSWSRFKFIMEKNNG